MDPLRYRIPADQISIEYSMDPCKLISNLAALPKLFEDLIRQILVYPKDPVWMPLLRKNNFPS